MGVRESCQVVLGSRAGALEVLLGFGGTFLRFMMAARRLHGDFISRVRSTPECIAAEADISIMRTRSELTPPHPRSTRLSPSPSLIR